MKIEYHKYWSSNLNQDMEFKVYGHAGKPVIVFPAQAGRFYEFEDFQMVEAVRPEDDVTSLRGRLADIGLNLVEKLVRRIENGLPEARPPPASGRRYP